MLSDMPLAQQSATVFREHAASVGGTTTAWFAFITANQQQFEYWMRISSLLLAMTASAFTIWNVVGKMKSSAAK